MSAIFADTGLFATIFAILVVSGLVKGTFGIGLPAIAMSLLPFVVEPALAVSILTLPIVVTNFQLVFTYPDWRAVMRRFLPAMATLFVTIFCASLMLKSISSDVITFVVGLTLVVFAVFAIFHIDLPANDGWRWQVAIGLFTGVIGGLTAVKTPVMIYTAALKLDKDAFVATSGCLFLVGGLGLTSGLVSSSVLTWDTLPFALVALAGGSAGFQLGSVLRKRINGEAYRRIILYILLAIGCRLMYAAAV